MYEDQKKIDDQCCELLNKGIICESTSAYASLVTLQFKKHGLSSRKEDRMCIDYCDLNRIIAPESQPFPLIEDIIAKTRGCSYFLVFDINSAFHSIPINEEDRHKTAFVTQCNHYKWRSLPFGLKTSAAAFQRILSEIIRRYGLSEFAINYLDNILIFSKTFHEHLVHIQKLVDALYTEGFCLNFAKYSFASSRIQYLGHILTPNSVEPLSDNVRAITEFPVPNSHCTIRQFLGKVNFYRKFIPNS